MNMNTLVLLVDLITLVMTGVMLHHLLEEKTLQTIWSSLSWNVVYRSNAVPLEISLSLDQWTELIGRYGTERVSRCLLDHGFEFVNLPHHAKQNGDPQSGLGFAYKRPR